MIGYCMKLASWLLLHQIYFYILHFAPLSENKILIQDHKTNLTRAYLKTANWHQPAI